MQGYNEQQQSKLEPVRRDLALIEAAIKDKSQELDGAMADLKVLSSPRAKATKSVEIAALEAVLDGLEAEKAKLLAQLETNRFTPEQVIGITAFMIQVAQDIETIRQAEARGQDLPELKMAVYEAKRRILVWLDVQVKLFMLDEKRKAEVTAKVCPTGEVLSVELDDFR